MRKKQQEEPKNEVEKAIQNRKQTYNGIYSDIGLVLDKFSTDELIKFYIEKYGESGKIDISFYPSGGEYRGSIWKDGCMIGDYVCNDSIALENLFPQLKFAW